MNDKMSPNMRNFILRIIKEGGQEYNEWTAKTKGGENFSIKPGSKVIVWDVSFRNNPYSFNFRNFYEFIGETPFSWILRPNSNYNPVSYSKMDYFLEVVPEDIIRAATVYKKGDRVVVIDKNNYIYNDVYAFDGETDSAWILKSPTNVITAFDKAKFRLEFVN